VVSGPNRIVATYDYRDEAGNLLYQTVRYAPKDFRQRRPDRNGGWLWNLDGVQRVLYRLPELCQAAPTDWVFVCEGEKDADRLAALGLTATTNPMGAGKWREEYADPLRGRRVGLLPDHDEPGRKHAAQVAASLTRHGAAEVKVLPLPGVPDKGDVSDWLAAGHTAGELLALAEGAATWTPPAVPLAVIGGAAVTSDEPTQTNTLSDFAAWVNKKLGQRSGRETKRRVSERLRDWLLERDRLLRDGPTSDTYLLTDDGAVVSLGEDRIELRATLAQAGLNPSEPAFEWIRADLEVAAFSGGRAVQLYHSATRTDDGTIGVSCGPTRYILARPGEPLMTRRNGEDGVLFASVTAFPPWNPDAPLVSPLTVAAFTPNLTAPPEVPSYTPDVQKRLLLTWLAGVVAGLRPLPLLAVLGDRGGGKSTLCRAIVQTFHGRDANVAALSADERDFWTNCTRRTLYALDNLDATPPPWLADALAAAVTGTRRQTRKLYTDADLSDRESIAALLVNSRTATFCRADVSERVIPLFVDDLTDDRRVADSDLTAEVAACRDGLLVYLLTKAAETAQKRKDAPGGLPARFLDYARWVWGWYAALGDERKAVPALTAWRAAQSLAVIEADPLLTAILEYGEKVLPEQRFRQSATEMVRVLTDAGAEIPYQGGGKAIANRLRELRSSLALAGWKLDTGVDEHRHAWFTLTRK
jgi:hypothetical protein